MMQFVAVFFLQLIPVFLFLCSDTIYIHVPLLAVVSHVQPRFACNPILMMYVLHPQK